MTFADAVEKLRSYKRPGHHLLNYDYTFYVEEEKVSCRIYDSVAGWTAHSNNTWETAFTEFDKRIAGINRPALDGAPA